MKVRIIKTDAGYVPQAFFDPWFNSRVEKTTEPKPKWHSIGGSLVTYWSDPEFVMNHCTYLFLWRAKRILHKFVKDNREYTSEYEVFLSQLNEPNVVYEAEV